MWHVTWPSDMGQHDNMAEDIRDLSRSFEALLPKGSRKSKASPFCSLNSEYLRKHGEKWQKTPRLLWDLWAELHPLVSSKDTSRNCRDWDHLNRPNIIEDDLRSSRYIMIYPDLLWCESLHVNHVRIHVSDYKTARIQKNTHYINYIKLIQIISHDHVPSCELSLSIMFSHLPSLSRAIFYCEMGWHGSQTTNAMPPPPSLSWNSWNPERTWFISRSISPAC